MTNKDLELQENIRKLAVKIVKHYRGKGPDNVKVKIEDQIITVEIRGVFSDLSKILMSEGAAHIVNDYWKIVKPHLEKEFLEKAYETVGGSYDYDMEVTNLENFDKSVTLKINRTMV